MIRFTKEAIAHRMVKNALSFWNLRDTEDLDPIVKMMIEALATELYQLHYEQQNTQINILDRVAQLMAPEYVTAPIPSNGLLHVECIEKTDRIEPKHAFTCTKQVTIDEATGKQEKVELFFCPVQQMQLHDLQPAMLITPRITYQLNDHLYKDKSIQTPATALETHEVWLGLRSNNEFDGLKDCTLYFYFNSLLKSDAQEAMRCIPYAKIYYQDKMVNTIAGLKSEKDITNKQPYDVMSTLDTTHHIAQEVLMQYSPFYITIDDDLQLASSEKSLSPFNDNTPEYLATIELNKEKLYWLKITFPLITKKEWLEQINIYTNIVPVVNKRLNELRYKLKGNSKIVPLRAPTAYDQFLNVMEVSDEATIFTTAGDQQDANGSVEGLYALVQGGIERFDARSAKEHISNLLELLRSESSTFSTYGYDFIASTLKDLHQKIALIEQKTMISSGQDHDSSHYLFVQPTQDTKMIFAEYWTTTGAFANGIKTGTRLQPYKHTIVKSAKNFFVNTIAHGRNRPTKNERLKAFRYSLMSRDSIITKQDIIQFCEMELGDDLLKVSVNNGMHYVGETNHNMSKTIDVRLQPKEINNREEWETKCSWIKSQLESKSVMGIYYTVEIDIND